jgi:hypothetical protein
MDIQNASQTLGRIFLANDNDNVIKGCLDQAWFIVNNVITNAGSPKQRVLIKNQGEFLDYVNSGKEQEFTNLVRSMAEKQEWADLFKHGTLLSCL